MKRMPHTVHIIVFFCDDAHCVASSGEQKESPDSERIIMCTSSLLSHSSGYLPTTPLYHRKWLTTVLNVTPRFGYCAADVTAIRARGVLFAFYCTMVEE